MKNKFKLILVAVTFTVLAQTAVRDPGDRKVSAEPFPSDPACACVRTHAKTKSAISREIAIGDRVFQVVIDRKTKKEIFRFQIGFKRGRYWNYGIAVEKDFNGDGLPDYSWYAGDDTSDEMFILLSQERGYRKLDVYKTIKKEWVRRFPRDSLTITSDSDALVRLNLVKIAGNLVLEATVQKFESQLSHTLSIPQSNFVYTKSTQGLTTPRLFP